jgi:glycosyltransferase involved in cell wall biosynthesis
MANFFIIVPTHNSAQYLERCLASILLVQPGGHNVHVHIQDNASTDATCDIAIAWSGRGATFTSEKDEGLYDALAKASSVLMAGQIMTWLGSDDLLMPGARSRLWRLLLKNYRRYLGFLVCRSLAVIQREVLVPRGRCDIRAKIFRQAVMMADPADL